MLAHTVDSAKAGTARRKAQFIESFGDSVIAGPFLRAKFVRGGVLVEGARRYIRFTRRSRSGGRCRCQNETPIVPEEAAAPGANIIRTFARPGAGEAEIRQANAKPVDLRQSLAAEKARAVAATGDWEEEGALRLISER